MDSAERIALVVLLRLHAKHGHAPFWLPADEFPAGALKFAAKRQWILRHGAAGKNLSLQITHAGALALRDFSPRTLYQETAA